MIKNVLTFDVQNLVCYYNEGYTVSEMTVLINEDLKKQYPDDEDYRVTDNIIRDAFAQINAKTNNRFDLRKKPQRKMVQFNFQSLDNFLATEFDTTKEEIDDRHHDLGL